MGSDGGHGQEMRQALGGKRLLVVSWLALVLVTVAILGCAAWLLWPLRAASQLPIPPLPPYTPGPLDLQDTLVLAPTGFVLGSEGSVRVIVYDPHSGLPIRDAQVRVGLMPQDRTQATRSLFAGRTDEQGSAAVRFQIPDDLGGVTQDPDSWALVIDTVGPMGEQRVVHPISLHQTVTLDLMVDRPRYRPGETIHLRSLAVGGPYGLPIAGAPVTFALMDPRGTRIGLDKVVTAADGVAFTSFELASRLRLGTYKVTATLGDIVVERTLAVEPYDLPRFQVEIEVGSPYYLLGEQASVTVRAAYPWGQPVVGAQVEVWGALAATPTQRIVDDTGITDGQGAFSFVFDLPDALKGDAAFLGKGDAINLVAKVTDGNGDVANGEAPISFANQPIWVQARSESPMLKPGMDNRIVLRTTYPDGSPASCTLDLRAPGLTEPTQVHTDVSGQAEFTYQVPASPGIGSEERGVSLHVSAQDAQGRLGMQSVELPIEPGEFHLRLRSDLDSYDLGDVMRIDVLVSRVPPHEGASPPWREPRAVYLDVLRNGQPVTAQSAALVQGVARFQVPVGPELMGPVELYAYVLLTVPSATRDALVRDAHSVLVSEGSGLAVTMVADKERYAPGDLAHVSLHVTGAEGQDRQSTVGAWAVADPVWVVPGDTDLGTGDALAGQGRIEQFPDPFSPPGDGAQGSLRVEASPPQPTELVPLHAERASRPHPVPDEVKQQFETVERGRAERREVLAQVVARIAAGLILFSLLLWGLCVAFAWRHSEPKQAVRSLLTDLALALALLPAILGGAALLTYLGKTLFGLGAVLVLGLGWFGGMLALLGAAWSGRSGWLQVMWALLVGYLSLAVGAHLAVAQGGALQVRVILACAAGLLAALLGIVMSGRGLLRSHRSGGMAMMLALSVLLAVTFWDISGVVDGGYGPAMAVGEAPASATPESTEGAPTPVPTLPLPMVLSVPTPAASPGWEEISPGSTLSSWETVFWAPHIATGPDGNVSLEVPVPRELATARLVALALTQEGEWGSAQIELSVKEPLSIDTNVPVWLTVGDQLDLPVRIENALPISQTAILSLTQSSWFRVRVRGMNVQQIEVPPMGTATAYLPITAVEWGTHTLSVTAASDQGSDAASYVVDVQPDGQHVVRIFSGQVEEMDGYKFRVPWSAVGGTDRVTVKLYPGWQSVLAEALDATALAYGREMGFALPQSAAGMRSLVLREVLAGEIAPGEDRLPYDLQRLVSLGYQTLLTFESDEYGFSTWGAAPPDLVQTALALGCLNEMSGLVPIDVALLDRTARWLLDSQENDGAWLRQEIPPTWQALSRTEIPSTAYVAWSLVESGYADSANVRIAMEHLVRYLDKAEDPYVLALSINALLAYREHGGDVPRDVLDAALARLQEQAVVERNLASWRSGIATLSGAISDGDGTSAADIEVTSLAVRALLLAQAYPDVAEQGLAMLAERRNALGTWGAPEAAWLALRAFEAAVRGREGVPTRATVRVSVNGVLGEPVNLSEGDIREVRALTFDELSKGYNDVEIAAEGSDAALYQVVGTYYLPWDQVPPPLPETEALSVEVSYDRTEVAVGELITVTVGAMTHQTGTVPLAVLELGRPPGLELLTEDWDELVQDGTIDRYEVNGGQIRAYMTSLSEGHPIHFSYRLRALFPLAVKTGQTRIYDAADAQHAAFREPAWIHVTETEP